MLRKFEVLVVATGLLCANGGAEGAPRAGLVASSWQLEFEFDDPGRLASPAGRDGQSMNYWYMPFRVTNRTGRDVEFYPAFRLVTDTLQIVIGGEEVDPRVYDVIAGLHANDYPFFAPPAKITGPLLQGEENARASAIVFRDFDAQASGFTVYVGGLSGDVVRVPNPSSKPGAAPTDAASATFLLQRTLAVRYELPGDPVTRHEATPVRVSREWVMR